MHALFEFSRRHRRLAPFFVLVFLLTALATGLACGGKAWLLVVPAMFILGRSYGTRAGSQEQADGAKYGVGAALAGFTPSRRD